MNEMGYGLKEIKMKCDQWSCWCDKEELMSSGYVIVCYKPITEQSWYQFNKTHKNVN